MVQILGSISEALKEIERNYSSVVLSAVQKATDVAVEDIYKFAMSTIDQYYANYNPSSYYRDYDLYASLVPIAEVSNQGSAVQCIAGVGFDGGAVDGKPGSSKYPNGASGTWIIENFLQGIHPTTNGARISEYVEYIPIADSVSANSLLNRYLGLYKEKMKREIYKNIVSQAISKL